MVRGSVKSSYLPWNVYESSIECVQFCTAFILKCFFVLADVQKNFHTDNLLKQILENQHFEIYFWESLKLNLENSLSSKLNFKSNSPIILCLPETQFAVRHQNNKDVEIFECFLMHLIKNGNGLVIFSQQNLTSPTSFILQHSHSMSHIKSTHNFKISIEDAFEPPIFENKNKTDLPTKHFSSGSFDRLLELLAMGQDFIFSIESAFLEKIKC